MPSDPIPLLHGASSPLLLLSSLILLLASHHCSGTIYPIRLIHSICQTGNYTNSSAFQANLGRLLSSLSSVAPTTDGYSINTVGQAPDRVYGLSLCRGDITASPCQDCLAEAARKVTEECPRRNGATVWYETCLLRYSNDSFFGTAEGGKYTVVNQVNVTDPADYGSLLGGLLTGLITRAVSSPRLFATGEVDVTNFTKIYGLVQCTRDISADDCENCLRFMIRYTSTCCASSQGGRQMGPSCFLRWEAARFYNTSGEPPAAATHLPATDRKDSTLMKITMAITIPLIILAAVLITAYCTCLRRRKKERKAQDGRLMEEEIGTVESSIFDLETLKIATDNFSDSNKLGEGGFGVVYKGVLPIGQQIAVKRLSSNSSQGLGELRNEVDLVAKLQHRNLVRLLGCCLGDGEKLLVYEYLPNKSLDRFLFDPIRSKHLNWERRVKIIEGIARGLLYLHEDSRLKVIHRDLKASNILLDDEMNPKIADFGLAKLFGNEQSQGNTSRIAGTYGYMAPEYVIHGQISTKSDVYSFGILVLEIVTGRKCVGAFHRSTPGVELLSYVLRHWDEGNALRVLDRNIIDGCSTQEVLRCIHIGLLCAQQDPQVRPNISSVVLMLSSYSVTLPTISISENSTYESVNYDEAAPMIHPHSNVADVGRTSETTNSNSRLSNNAVSDITVLEPR